MTDLFKKLCLFFLAFAVTPAAIACSFGGGVIFQPSTSSIENGTIGAPLMELESIKRGFSDGNPGSCSDAGVIVLKVERSDLGYLIKVSAGNINRYTFPDVFMTPHSREPGLLRYAWLDDPRLPSEDISATLEVIAMDSFGNQSAPFEVEIVEAGAVRKTSGLPLPPIAVPDY